MTTLISDTVLEIANNCWPHRFEKFDNNCKNCGLHFEITEEANRAARQWDRVQTVTIPFVSTDIPNLKYQPNQIWYQESITDKF